MNEASFRGTTLEVINRRQDEAATATSVVFNLEGIAKDKILILNNVSGICTPGATQACVSVAINGFTPAGAAFNIFRLKYVETADINEHYNWQGEVWMRGRGGTDRSLNAQAIFDAGVASNQLAFSFSGYIIPRANVSEF